MAKPPRPPKWNQLFDKKLEGNSSPDPNANSENLNDDDEGSSSDAGSELTSRQIDEILFQQPSDHPGMQLVTAPLTGNNFLNWSKSIRRALATRSKLEFLDGSFPEPDPSVKYYKKWLKADYMVSTWIVNSISKELVNAFFHLDSTQKIWSALMQRFGRSNGPKIYKLQREIFFYKQGDQSVLMYFNNLCALWDELNMLLPPLECACSSKSAKISREEQQRLVKFLVGLNDYYEQARRQIMSLEPLPSVDRAYSMVVQVKDQKILD